VCTFLAKKYAKTLQDEKRLTVGVLKFLVRRDKNVLNQNVGPLNQRLADRLEVALILALRDARIRVLHNSSNTVAEKMNRRANHRTEKGRIAFFDNRYSPAWGDDDDLPADVFLTGTVTFDKTCRTAKVAIDAFDKSGALTRVCAFEARAEPRTLTEAGVSFRSRGGSLDLSRLEQPEEIEKEMPIAFEILYDGKPVALKDGAVPEPREKQKVSFRLRHRGRDKLAYGVVLKINGKNTIYPDATATDDASTWKWVLAPKDQIEIKGFQTGLKGAKAFTVAPNHPEDASLIRYNPHVGTFQLVIFRPLRAGEKEAEEEKTDSAKAAIARGVSSARARQDTLLSLQKQLAAGPRRKSTVNARGMVEGGDDVTSKVKEVPFKPSAAPIYSLTVRYYAPDKD
jgi:hypothetical protein